MRRKNEGSQRVVLLFMFGALLLILAASLWQRFLHPSLVINKIVPDRGEAVRDDSPQAHVIGQLMEAVGRDPKDKKVLTQLVESLMASGNWSAAEKFAQRLLGLDATDQEEPRSLFLMAVINHNQGRHQQAAELFEKLLARSEDPHARYSLGLIYLHFLNNREEGIKQMRKGLESIDAPEPLVRAIKTELEKAEAQNSPADADAAKTQEAAE